MNLYLNSFNILRFKICLIIKSLTKNKKWNLLLSTRQMPSQEESSPSLLARPTKRLDSLTTDPIESQSTPSKEHFLLVFSLRRSKFRVLQLLIWPSREHRMFSISLMITSQAHLTRTPSFSKLLDFLRSSVSRNSSRSAQLSMSSSILRTSKLLLR